MSKLLVLDYGTDTHTNEWLERVFSASGCELRKVDSAANDDDSTPHCDAVLVVDDGNSDGVMALHSALRMRRGAPNLPIAIIKPVSNHWSESEAPARGMCSSISENVTSHAQLNTAQVRAIFTGSERKDIDMHISNDAILFEYQG